MLAYFVYSNCMPNSWDLRAYSTCCVDTYDISHSERTELASVGVPFQQHPTTEPELG
jgi:hypothetical protein